MNIRRTIPLVAIAAVAIIAAMLAGPTQPSAQSPAWDTVTDSVLPVANQTTTGPGYKPPAPAANTCKCEGCLTEADVRKIVALELATRGYATTRPTTANGSNGGHASVSKPTTTAGLPYGSVVVSERVVSSQPTYQSAPQTTVRTGLFGRRVYTQSCRIVNGVRVCQ